MKRFVGRVSWFVLVLVGFCCGDEIQKAENQEQNRVYFDTTDNTWFRTTRTFRRDSHSVELVFVRMYVRSLLVVFYVEGPSVWLSAELNTE